MANNSPTIVAASLSDDQLKKSIDSLVTHVDEAMKKMVQSTNKAVGDMEAKLKSLGNLKIDSSGSADGGASKRAKAQNTETASVEKTITTRDKQIKKNQEVAMSFDQMAAAIQKASRMPSEMRPEKPETRARDSYYAFVAGLKEQSGSLAKVINDFERGLNNAISKRANEINNQITASKNKIQELNQELNRANATRNAARASQVQGQLDKELRHYKDLELQLKNVNNEFGTSKISLAAMNTEHHRLANLMREETSSTQQQAQAQQQLTQGAQRNEQAEREAARAAKEHAEQVKRMAEETRIYLANEKASARLIEGRTGGMVYAENDARAKGLTIEQQIDAILRQEVETFRSATQSAQQQLGVEQQITKEYEKRRNYKAPQTSINESFRRMTARTIGVDTSEINSTSTQIAKMTNYVKQLEQAYSKLTDTGRRSPFGVQLREEFQMVSRTVQKLRSELSRPINLKSVMGLSEKTLDDIAYKMRQLSTYRSGLDVSRSSKEISQVNDEYNRLKKRMDEVMQKNQQMIASNTALGRSWNYMKNRLAFYFTVGASTSFIKNLIEVRSQYEMNERALGILINSAERGTQIFNELSQMALVSPYTLIELSSAAKQLTAYDVAAKDVVDTTRRLADMAAAVGIPIERLTYALGQIKAYGYLNSRDNRMFANAGIPLVKQLSDYYTELEGRLVSTADVYDRIKKKQVGYEEVMNVISRMTDEGGKFYDFQAKMAETLKVQLANLTLAWNNMLNAMGEESQGVLVGGIGALKQMFLHWKDIEHILTEVVVVLGAYKAYQLITTRLMGATSASLDAQILAMKRNNAAMLEKQALTRKLTVDELRQVATQNQVTAADYRNALSGKQLTKQKALLLVALNKNNVQLKAAIVNMGLLTAQEAANVTTGRALAIVFKSIGISIRNAAMAMKAFMVSNWWMLALGGIYELYHAWDSYNEHVAEINRSAAEHAKEAYENIKQYLEGDVISALQDNLAKGGKVSSDAEGQKAWDEMREKIELSSSASNVFIARLMQIDDINERLSAGFGYLEDIQRVAGVMETLGKDAIIVSTTTLGGLFGEGVKDDLNDFVDAYQKYVDLNENLRQGSVGEDYFNKQKKALEEFRGEVEKTTTSLYNIASKEGFNTNEQREFFERGISETAQAEQMGIKETRIYRMQAEQEYYAYAKAKLEEQLQYQQGEQKAATERRLQELKNEFGANKTMQETFFTWLTEKQNHTVKNMLRGKTQEEIKQGDWLKGANAKWVEEMARKFSQEYGVSFDDLYRLVLNANTWAINIPVFFQTIGQPLSDVQRDYEARTGKKFKDNPLIKDAKSQVEIIDILKKKQKEVAQEMDTAEKAGGKYWKNNKQRYKEENDALVADIHAYNARTDAEEKANKKSGKGGSKKDVLGDALTKEVQLIGEIQKRFKEYQKIGVDAQEAIRLATEEYDNTLKRTNATLAKYGISTKTSEELAGMNIRDVRDYYKSLLEMAKSTGNAKGIEAIEKALANINVEITKLDYKKITDGLNNELGKLKDEYELAVELDANPEMGNMFAEMFGIDTSGLPKSIDEYMYRAQQEFDKKRAELKYNAPLDIFRASPEDWERWGKEVGLSEEALKSFNGKFVEAQGLAKKWATDIVNNTKKLEYELADLDKKIAIKEQEQLDLQKQIEEESNIEQKHYLMLLYQNNEKVINELRAQALSLMPEYARVFNGIAEHSAVVARRLQQDLKRIFDTAKFDSSTNKWTLTSGNGKQTILDDKTYRREREKLTREMRKSQSPFQKIKEAFKPSDKDGVVDYVKGIELLSGEIQKLGKVASEVGNLAQIFGADEQTVEIIKDVATSLNGVATAGQGIAQIASGDYIGGAASVLSGVVSVIGAWADNSDKQISAEIKESELAVKRLELTYKNLEVAIENAYGANVIGAKQAAIANKKLQLAELKRQLALEKARDSKHRDEARIVELQGQIIDLQNDIKRSAQEIATELLGISSVGDAALSFMDAYISALRKGEDAQAAFTGSWKEMIANMIKQLWVTKVIAPQLERLVDDLNERLTGRSVAEAKAYQDAVNELTNRQNMSDNEIREKFIQDELDRWMREEWDKNPITLFLKRQELMDSITQEQIDAYRREAEDKVKETKMNLDKATTPTVEDMRLVAQAGEDLIPLIQASDDAINAMLDEFGLNDYSNNLSSLQQGLQGMSESTASAVEAYLNGISQQCYLQSDLLTQIRDTVQSFDIDVQTGTLSEMLLQLQQSYQVQMSIQNILQGVLTPSGQGFRVELLS